MINSKPIMHIRVGVCRVAIINRVWGGGGCFQFYFQTTYV